MLKLARLADRTPVKVTIALAPDLHQSLIEYGELYAKEYDSKEPITDLIPAMLTAFLASDRAFAKAHKTRAEAR